MNYPEAVENLIRGIRGGFNGHEFHQDDHNQARKLGLGWNAKWQPGTQEQKESPNETTFIVFAPPLGRRVDESFLI